MWNSKAKKKKNQSIRNRRQSRKKKNCPLDQKSHSTLNRYCQDTKDVKDFNCNVEVLFQATGRCRPSNQNTSRRTSETVSNKAKPHSLREDSRPTEYCLDHAVKRWQPGAPSCEVGDHSKACSK